MFCRQSQSTGLHFFAVHVASAHSQLPLAQSPLAVHVLFDERKH